MSRISTPRLFIVVATLLIIASVGFGFTRLRLQVEKDQQMPLPEELFEEPESENEGIAETLEDAIISPEQICENVSLSIFNEQK